MKLRLIVFSVIVNFSSCRDYCVGMFQKNDFLVASDTLYKEKNPFGHATAKYGRVFKCPITYYRVADRFGVGRPPRVQLTRGGLRMKYLTLTLTASYGQPIGVNIYVGCKNDMTTTIPTTTILPTTTTTKGLNETNPAAATKAGVGGDGKESTAAGGDGAPAESGTEAAAEGGDAAPTEPPAE